MPDEDEAVDTDEVDDRCKMLRSDVPEDNIDRRGIDKERRIGPRMGDTERANAGIALVVGCDELGDGGTDESNVTEDEEQSPSPSPS